MCSLSHSVAPGVPAALPAPTAATQHASQPLPAAGLEPCQAVALLKPPSAPAAAMNAPSPAAPAPGDSGPPPNPLAPLQRRLQVRRRRLAGGPALLLVAALPALPCAAVFILVPSLARHRPPTAAGAAGAARQEHAAPAVPLARAGGAAAAVRRPRLLPARVRAARPPCTRPGAPAAARQDPSAAAWRPAAAAARHAAPQPCHRAAHALPQVRCCCRLTDPSQPFHFSLWVQLLHCHVRPGHLYAQPAAGLPQVGLAVSCWCWGSAVFSTFCSSPAPKGASNELHLLGGSYGLHLPPEPPHPARPAAIAAGG